MWNEHTTKLDYNGSVRETRLYLRMHYDALNMQRV